MCSSRTCTAAGSSRSAICCASRSPGTRRWTPRWLRSPLSMRQIGAGFGADDMSARVVEPVPDKYDVLLFVEQTTRARPVERD